MRKFLENIREKISGKPKVGNSNVGISKKVGEIIGKGYIEEQIRNYFNPENVKFINEEVLKKIIEGKIINPHKLKNADLNTDYGFFIICTDGIENFEGDKFLSEHIDICYKSNWFGLFNIYGTSRIVIPNKSVISMNSSRSIILNDIVKRNVWNLDGGFFQLDKNFYTNIIRCNVSVDEMQKMINEINTFNS